MSSSLLTPDTGLLFWMLISFGAVLFILSKFGFPVITKALDKRKKYIDDSIIAAQKAYTELEEVRTDSEKIIKSAREEHAYIIKTATQRRDLIIEKAKKEAAKEASHIVDVARKQITHEKEAALADMRREIAVLSVDIAEKILRENLKEKDEQMNMITRLVDEISLS